MSKIVGITGAGGMIGSAVLNRLVQTSPDLRIRCFMRHPRTLVSSPNVSCFSGDLMSEADCEEFVDGVDTVIHLAQSNSPAASDRHWPSDCNANLLTTLNLLNALRATKECIHFVFASSGGAIYGDHPKVSLYHENLPCFPLSPYGIQKLAIEHYLSLGVAQGWLSACALRISNAYGSALPAERRQGLIGVAVARHRGFQPVDIFGSSETVRDYVHIDDVASAFIAALNLQDGFHAINIASAQGHSVQNILDLIGNVSGRVVETRQTEFACRQFALTPRLVLANQKAESQLNWVPQISLIDGIKRLWQSDD